MEAPSMHSDNAYQDHVTARHSDVAGSHASNLFLPDQSIQYHNPGSSSSTSNAAAIGATTDSSSVQSSPFSRHLGRNRACASCRDRKLKCDGLRPICGQCSRAWATRKRSLKAKGVNEHELRDMEQPCSYLDVQQRSERGVGRASKGNARGKSNVKAMAPSPSTGDVEREMMLLEQELANLRARLHLQNSNEHSEAGNLSDMVQSHPNPDELSIAEILATTMRSGDGFPNSESRQASIPPLDEHNLQSFVGSLTGSSSQMNKLNHPTLDSSKAYHHPIRQLTSHQLAKNPIDPLLLSSGSNIDPYKREDQSDATMLGNSSEPSQLVLSNWPADFPSPATAEHLCQIFFEKCHYLRCLFQPSRFFEQLSHGPSSPRFPSFTLLHSIFAMSYALRPDLDAANTSLSRIDGLILNTEGGMTSVKYHCDRVKLQLMNLDGRKGSDLFTLCKAALILTNVQLGLGHMLGAWASSGIANKLATALCLNRGKSEETETKLAGHQAKVEYLSTSLLGPSCNWIEEEERRRVVFYAFAADRASAASVLWTSGIKEADMSTSLPMCSTQEFHQERIDGTLSTGQTLHSADLFSHHVNDSFVLFLKGLILVGRCGEFLARLPSIISLEDVKVPEWFHLSDLVSTFSTTIPDPPLEDLMHQSKFDSTRLLTGLVIHTCALQLHEPLARLDENSVSMCRAACTGICNTLRYLNASNFDITPFSPMFPFTVGIAGRVLVRLLDMSCKSSTSPSTYRQQQTSDFARQSLLDTSSQVSISYNFTQTAGLGGGTGSEWERMLQNDIDVIFITLCKYGRIWPIAMRQAKAIASHLGVKVTSPELLRHGIFTDRNNGVHIYR